MIGGIEPSIHAQKKNYIQNMSQHSCVVTLYKKLLRSGAGREPLEMFQEGSMKAKDKILSCLSGRGEHTMAVVSHRVLPAVSNHVLPAVADAERAGEQPGSGRPSQRQVLGLRLQAPGPLTF